MARAFPAILLLTLAHPALAVLPEAPAPAATTPPTIAADAGPETDSRIAARIRGIFGEIDGLERVTVEVSSGVVTLDGKASGENRERAEAIASRVAGVVTVENGIERDLKVSRNLDPAIGGIREKANTVLRAAPLAGVALAVAILVALVGYFLAGLTRLWQRIMPNAFLAEMIATAIRFSFTLAGIVIALDILGATALLGAVLGGAGVVGIALGFAMRDTIENYVASLMLSLRQPFRANDHVVIDSYEGRVIRLTSRATVLMTLDGNHLRIPNGAVFKAVILNYTTNPQRRFEFELGIDAGDDPNSARHVGVDAMLALDFVLDDPAPSARLEQVGDSNIVIKFLAWIDQREVDWFKARSRTIAAVKAALEKGGFALPEPIYRLRFDNAPDASPGRGHAGAAQPVAAPEGPPPQDIAPENDIVEMVEKERAETSRRDRDLLDPGRPVE